MTRREQKKALLASLASDLEAELAAGGGWIFDDRGHGWNQGRAVKIVEELIEEFYHRAERRGDLP